MFFASDRKQCKAYSNSSVRISRNDFGTVEYSENEPFGYYFLDRNNITVDEYEADSTAFSEDTDAALVGRELSVNIKTEAEEKRKFTVVLLRKNEGEYDWSVPGLVYCGTLDAEGSFAQRFLLSDYMPLGSYDILIYADGIGEPWGKSGFYYAGKQKREEIIRTIKTGSKSDLDTLLNSEDDREAMKSLGIVIDRYYDLQERKSFVSELVCAAPAGEKKDPEQCIGLLNRCILLQLLNESDDQTDFLLNNLSTLEISERVADTLTFLAENGDPDALEDFLHGKVYGDFPSFYKKLDESALLAGLNTVKEGDYPLVLQYLKDYKDVLDYDISEQMTKQKITEYQRILILKSLIGNRFQTKKDVVNAITGEMKRYTRTVSGGSGSGGSGSGGSGSGGSSGGSGSGGSSASGTPKSSGVTVPSDGIPQPSLRTTFTDVDESFWANSYILALTAKNVINGYEDHTFRPNQSITRAEFVKILVAALFPDFEASGTPFDDVGESHWAYRYISFAYQNGLINGVDETHFSPDKSITNEEMAAVCSRTVKFLKIGIPNQAFEPFRDFNGISDYAKMPVTELRALGIIEGNEDHCFLPKHESTRAQTAKVIYRILDLRGEE